MSKENIKTITINDKDYTEDQLNDHQKNIINHNGDLYIKSKLTQF